MGLAQFNITLLSIGPVHFHFKGLLGGIFHFIQILKETSVRKQWRTCFVASDLVLH